MQTKNDDLCLTMCLNNIRIANHVFHKDLLNYMEKNINMLSGYSDSSITLMSTKNHGSKMHLKFYKCGGRELLKLPKPYAEIKIWDDKRLPCNLNLTIPTIDSFETKFNIYMFGNKTPTLIQLKEKSNVRFFSNVVKELIKDLRAFVSNDNSFLENTGCEITADDDSYFNTLFFYNGTSIKVKIHKQCD